MKLNERYESVVKEIDEKFSGKPKTDVSYESVVKEVDEYFETCDLWYS